MSTVTAPAQLQLRSFQAGVLTTNDLVKYLPRRWTGRRIHHPLVQLAPALGDLHILQVAFDGNGCAVDQKTHLQTARGETAYNR